MARFSDIVGLFLIKAIIPLALVGYEMIISYPTRARGIIVDFA